MINVQPPEAAAADLGAGPTAAQEENEEVPTEEYGSEDDSIFGLFD